MILIPEVYVGKDSEQDFHKLTVKSICMDMIDARRAGITFFDDDGKIVLIFFVSDTGKNVAEKVEELTEILKTECDIKPRAVVGSQVQGLDSLYVSYNDALRLMEQERKGFRKIVRSSSEQDREQIIQDIYREFKQAMIADIAQPVVKLPSMVRSGIFNTRNDRKTPNDIMEKIIPNSIASCKTANDMHFILSLNCLFALHHNQILTVFHRIR